MLDEAVDTYVDLATAMFVPSYVGWHSSIVSHLRHADVKPKAKTHVARHEQRASLLGTRTLLVTSFWFCSGA